MRTVVFASMRTYARRYVAALLAVVIATAFIVAINALSAAAREGSTEAVTQQYGAADLAIIDAGEADAFADAARLAAEDPGVQAVTTTWDAYADITLPDGPQSVVIGSIASSPILRWQQATSGRLPSRTDEIAISTSKATAHGILLGDTVSLVLPDGIRRLTVTGTVDAKDGPLAAAAYLAECTFTALPDLGSPRDVVLSAAEDRAAVMSRLQPALDRATVVAGDEYRADLRLQATQGIDVFQKLIYVFAGISLFVGALVIANTFSILLAQRSRDLAMLRCVGAVRAQLARSVVFEGIAIGMVGSVVGVALGFGIAMGGVTLIEQLSPDTPMGSPSLGLTAMVIPALLGVAVTAAGAFLPAQRAGAQSPLAALHPQDVVELRSRAGALRLIAAVGLLLLGGAGLLSGLSGSLLTGMAGGMLSFIGVLLLTPVIVPAAIRAVGPLARRVGLAGRLAHMNSLRNPRRTAATSTALLVGVTLITAVVVGTASISHKVNTSLDVNNPIDLIASTQTDSVPDRTIDDIRHVSGVEAVATLPGTLARVGEEELTVLGVDRNALAIIHGTAEFDDLGLDEIVLPSTTTLGPEGASGESIAVTIGGETRRMKAFYASGISDAPLVSQATLESMGVFAGDTRSVWVRASTDADPGDVTSDVTAIARSSELDVTGGLPDRADIREILDVMLGVTIGLLAVAVVIALIGVGNTLSLSVLERVRENSLLRALGLGRSGLRAMLAIEALLMAGVSAVVGVALGTVYAWFGVQTASIGVFRSAPGLTIPWGQIWIILVVAALAGLVACVLPARRAARIAPAAGLVAD